jgi:hypothetical protein
MIEQDDDYSTLHQEDRAKKEIFREDDEPKKKKATKGKTRKTKSESDSASGKGVMVLPLSMLPQTDEDRAIFDNKSAALKASRAPRKPYDVKNPDRFSVGEVVDHKTFGIGFVAAEVGLNKMEVIFKTGRKLLIQAPREQK